MQMKTSRTPVLDIDSLPRLGELEIAVLESLWQAGEASVREVHERVGQPRGISANTVQSALERLFRKGLLERRKHGHAFHYVAAVGREQLVAGLMAELVGRFGGDPVGSLTAFVSHAEGLDDAALDRLELALQRRKGQRA
jgi:predicted transcriptional regulator